MSRSFALAVVGAALVAPIWPGGGDAVAAPTAEHGSADLLECKRGRQMDDRRAVFRGEMSQIEDGLRMQMRFHLSEKVGSSPWTGRRTPGIEVPHEARPGIERFAYRQRVLALKKGSSYRVEIGFRWLTADGKEVKREVERSPVCRMPGKLANPKIRDDVNVKDGPTPDTRRYIVRVGNTGSVTTQNIFLRLLVDGAEVDTRRINRLNPGQRREIGFVGPLCRGSVVAQIDPEDLIPEISEQDNVVKTPCERLVPR